MTNSNFYDYDSATFNIVHQVMQLMNEKRFEEAIETIQKSRNAGVDAVDFYSFEPYALYELGRYDEAERLANNAVILMEIRKSADGELAQYATVLADAVTIFANCAMMRKDYKSAESNIRRLWKYADMPGVSEISRTKAVAAIIRYCIETGNPASAEKIRRDYMASFQNQDLFRNAVSSAYLCVADSFYSSLPNDPSMLYLNTQKDFDNRIYWLSKACEICPDSLRAKYTAFLKNERKLGTKIVPPHSYLVYLAGLVMFGCIVTALAVFISPFRLSNLLALLMSAVVGVPAWLIVRNSQKPVWMINRDEIIKYGSVSAVNRPLAPAVQGSDSYGNNPYYNPQGWEQDYQSYGQNAAAPFYTQDDIEKSYRDEAHAREIADEKDRLRAEYLSSFDEGRNSDFYVDRYGAVDSGACTDYYGGSAYNGYDGSYNYGTGNDCGYDSYSNGYDSYNNY